MNTESRVESPVEPSVEPPTGLIGRGLRACARLEVIAALIAVVPVVVAMIRAVGGRWIPMGDNALVEIRSRDVFSTTHFPFLGTWSSASLSAGKDLNHPGPLLFDLLAVPVRLLGGPAGVAIGIGLVNVAAIIGCALVGYRLLGRTGSLAATATAGVLAWTLGSVLLTDPWNPHVLVLPCLVMLLLAAGVAAGRLGMLPWLVAVASLCLQVHLGYAYLVPALSLSALAGAVIVYRRRWRLDPTCRPGDVRSMGRSAIGSIVVFVVLWAQPLIEQLFGTGEGNLSRILSSTGGDEPTLGLPLGMRLVAKVMALPPWWGRSSFTGSIEYAPYAADGVSVRPTGLPGATVAVLAVALTVAVLVMLANAARRRRDRQVVALVGVAIVAIVVSVASLAISPFGPLGLTPHQMRWLWSVSAFVTFTIVAAALPIIEAAVGRRLAAGRTLPMDRALAAVVGLVAVLSLPFHAQAAGPAMFRDQQPTARSLAAQIDGYHPSGSVLVTTSDLRFAESYSTVVMASLQRSGVDFRVEENGLVRQFGDARRADGNEAVRLRLAEGRRALDERAGVTRIALASPLGRAEIDDLLAGEIEMTARVAAGAVSVSEAGETAIAAGRFAMSRDEIAAQMADPALFVGNGLASEMVAAGALDIDPASQDLFTRISSLRRRIGLTTVAVYAEDLTG